MPNHKNQNSTSAGKVLPLAIVIRRHRHLRWVILASCICLLTLICLADHAGFFVYPGDMLTQFEGRWFTVDKVVDGDTLDIRTGDGDTTVRLRLWGIDTPEVANITKGTSDQPYAQQAKAWTTEHCMGKQVRITLQHQRIWGTYGRLLCYVHLDDGSMLNEQLLLQGLARIDNRFVHDHMQRFDILQQQAQFNRVGLWSSRQVQGDEP